ncbi:MAG: ribosome biogenesis GTPase Der [Patescibacteria group bacterium]|jgi:GTP-binding protein|nr:ribosome biogenesis GTPase Der [Patescibacteria group bacterium]
MNKTKRTPVVAIVGRTNVGKSSLYNTFLAKKSAITAKEEGTTRDSLMSKLTWNNSEFWIVDTAGIKTPEDDFEFSIQDQILQAVENADLILFVVEADVPFNNEDRRLSKNLLKSKKPTFLVINKIDKIKDSWQIDHFNHSGIKHSFLTSTTQKRGIKDLLDSIAENIPIIHPKKETKDKITISLIGRPNVGKSHLFNSLLKKQQAIVSARAGTTRDINRNEIKFNGKTIQILDTAGIRRPGKIEVGIEKFSVLRTLTAINESAICLLLLDVNEIDVQLDQKIAGLIKDSGRGIIIIVSKWDAAVDKDPFLRDKLAKIIKHNFDFVPYAPLIFSSSVTGQNVTKIFEVVLEVYEQRHKKILTRKLNDWLSTATARHAPAGLKNRTPKLNYMVQETDNDRPAFKIFGSNTKYIHWSYKRYLENKLRMEFGFDGNPIELWFIEKHEAHKYRQRINNT